MHLLFVDESGTIPPKDKIDGNGFFVLGGIVIPEDLWHELNSEFANLKQQFDITGEIKWRYFSPQKPGEKSHSLSHLEFQQKEELRLSIYKLVTKFQAVTIIYVLIDVQQAYKNDYIKNQNDLYGYAYKFITERFQYYLQDFTRENNNKANGIVVCDHRHSTDDEHLRLFHQKLLKGSEMHISKYANLIEGVFIVPSHQSLGIQIADMVAGAVYRHCVKQDSRYFDLIKQSFRKNLDEQIQGYGLNKWPRD